MNKINKNFLKSSYLVTNLKLCTIRLNDNSKFPWLILIPRRKNIKDMTELNSKDQILLMKEIIYVSKIVKKLLRTLNLPLNFVKKKSQNKVIQLIKDSIKTCLVITRESFNLIYEVMEGD